MEGGLLGGLDYLVDSHSCMFDLSRDEVEERQIGGMNRHTEELTKFPMSINADLLCYEVSTACDDACHLPGNERLVTRDYEFEDVVFKWKPRSTSSFWSLIVVVKAAFHLDDIDTERSKPFSGNGDVR